MKHFYYKDLFLLKNSLLLNDSLLIIT